MRSAAIFASAVTFAASVTAQVPGFAAMSEPTQDEKVAAGQPFTIKWSAGKYTGPVDVVLLAGATPSTLVPGATLASGLDVTSGSFAWNVDCSLGKDATYGIKIVSEGNANLFQYSFPFHINNSGCSQAPKPTESETGYPTAPKPTETGYPTAPKPTETGYPTAPKPTESTTTKSVYPTVPAPAPTVSSSSSVVIPSSYPVPPASSPVIVTSASSAVPSASSSAPAAPTNTIPTAGAGRNAAGSLVLAAAVAALAL